MTSVVDNIRSLNCSGKYSGPQPQTFAAAVNMTLGELKNSTNGNKLAVVAGRLNSSKNGTARGDFVGYGKAQCYLYLSQTACGRCIENSKIYAQDSPALQNCSALQIWSESCFLKYWVSYPDSRAAVNSPPGRSGSLDGNRGNLSYPLMAPSGSPINPVPVLPVSTGTPLFFT